MIFELDLDKVRLNPFAKINVYGDRSCRSTVTIPTDRQTHITDRLLCVDHKTIGSDRNAS